MTIETIFCMLTGVVSLKKFLHRTWPALRARLAYVVAAFDLCTPWIGEVKVQLAPFAV